VGNEGSVQNVKETYLCRDVTFEGNQNLYRIRHMLPSCDPQSPPFQSTRAGLHLSSGELLNFVLEEGTFDVISTRTDFWDGREIERGREGGREGGRE